MCHLQFMHKSNSINRYSSQFTFSTATLHLQIVSVFWKGGKNNSIDYTECHPYNSLKISGQLCFVWEFPVLRSRHNHVLLRIQRLLRNSMKCLIMFSFWKILLKIHTETSLLGILRTHQLQFPLLSPEALFKKQKGNSN